jgi:hypothetical protein
MDEEYVQEHILTGGIVAPVGGASPSDPWPLTAIFFCSALVVTGFMAYLDHLPALGFRSMQSATASIGLVRRRRGPN